MQKNGIKDKERGTKNKITFNIEQCASIKRPLQIFTTYLVVHLVIEIENTAVGRNHLFVVS